MLNYCKEVYCFREKVLDTESNILLVEDPFSDR